MWGQIILFGGFVEAGIYDGNMQYENMFSDKVSDYDRGAEGWGGGGVRVRVRGRE